MWPDLEITDVISEDKVLGALIYYSVSLLKKDNGHRERHKEIELGKLRQKKHNP